MNDISYILSLTTPVFILMGIGYLVVSKEWLAKDNIKTISWFVIHIGLPPAMFKALNSRSLEDILHYEYFLLYAIGSMIPFFLLYFYSKWRKKNTTESAFFALGGALPNSLMIGFPIIYQLFGDAALVPFALSLIVENLIILPVALSLAEIGQKKEISFFTAFIHTLPRLLKNPVIVAIILGVLSIVVDVQPPAVANRVIDLLSSTVAGMALFAIGGMLVGTKGVTKPSDIYPIVVTKLLIHPLSIFLCGLLLVGSVPQLFLTAAIVLASMPMFSVYAVLASRFGLGEKCSMVFLPTTLLSFFSINLILWLIAIA